MENLFSLTAIKKDYQIKIKLNGNYSIAQLDVSFKDICIFLKEIYSKKGNLLSDKDGSLKIFVDDYNRDLIEKEQELIILQLLPTNPVTIENIGFNQEEIQNLLYNVYNQLPSNYRNNFMYSVDFKFLKFQ